MGEVKVPVCHTWHVGMIRDDKMKIVGPDGYVSIINAWQLPDAIYPEPVMAEIKKLQQEWRDSRQIRVETICRVLSVNGAVNGEFSSACVDVALTEEQQKQLLGACARGQRLKITIEG